MRGRHRNGSSEGTLKLFQLCVTATKNALGGRRHDAGIASSAASFAKFDCIGSAEDKESVRVRPEKEQVLFNLLSGPIMAEGGGPEYAPIRWCGIGIKELEN
mmetsp:Transcript_31638/g.68450  ORF Transcript_31638/g.68450 Transcript_31638/m.68450 type:complete len:102 (+) Transcript_31638:2907-3212(+)